MTDNENPYIPEDYKVRIDPNCRKRLVFDVDVTGVGAVVADRLKDAGFKVVERCPWRERMVASK